MQIASARAGLGAAAKLIAATAQARYQEHQQQPFRLGDEAITRADDDIGFA